MGADNVIPLWNDRRVAPSTAPKLQQDPKTRIQLHEHITTQHGRGIPKSSTLARLRNAHDNLHLNDGLSFTHETKHVHE